MLKLAASVNHLYWHQCDISVWDTLENGISSLWFYVFHKPSLVGAVEQTALFMNEYLPY
jgi:hypothetical protein